MRSSLDYAGLAQLCGRSPIMHAHNRTIPPSLQKRTWKKWLAGRTFKSESKSKSIAFKSKFKSESKSSKKGLKSGLESKSELEYYKSAVVRRREDISQTFFCDITQLFSCLFFLLLREQSLISRCRTYKKYPRVYTRIRRYCSFVNYALNNYQDKITNVYSHLSSPTPPLVIPYILPSSYHFLYSVLFNG